MVDLPRHVHKVTKSRRGGASTTYVFYTRHRNTANALPSIQLPDPLSSDFASAYAICEALERCQDGWTLYGAEIPSHREKGFWDAARKVYAAKQRRDHSDAKDFTALVEAFEAFSPLWGDDEGALSKSTKRGYRAYGKMVVTAWAFDLPADLTTVDAQEAIDDLSDTPATANQFRAYLSRLMAWGIPRGYCTGNPVEFTEKVPGGEPWKPWPEWAFETLIAHAPLRLLLPAISALFTGQRQSDVIAMRRPRGNVIEVRAQKTKKTVWIPVHREYQAWIDRAPKAASTQLHVGARGVPFASADSFRTEWQKLMDKEAFKRFREERIVFHGLRKNAVINLLEVGCTEAQVGAIVNMSEQMVRHYGREVSIRALARDGMKLLENRWAEVRPDALSGTGTERELETDPDNWKPGAADGSAKNG